MPCSPPRLFGHLVYMQLDGNLILAWLLHAVCLKLSAWFLEKQRLPFFCIHISLVSMTVMKGRLAQKRLGNKHCSNKQTHPHQGTGDASTVWDTLGASQFPLACMSSAPTASSRWYASQRDCSGSGSGSGSADMCVLRNRILLATLIWHVFVHE